MDKISKPTKKMVLPKEFKNLTAVEKLVYNALVNEGIKSNELSQIAQRCKLTEIQVIVALQLLIHKKILPTDELLS